jgi:hypothetical protein
MRIRLQSGFGARAALRRAAFTIIEMWMSMAIGSVCMGAAGVIYLEVAKQQRMGLADAVLGQGVDNLEDQLTRLLRTMSATEGATLGSPSTNAAMFRVAVVSAGSGQPQQKVYFNPTLGSVIHDPNKDVAGDEIVLWHGEANALVLKDLYFVLGLKEGYRPDGSLLNVCMELNDAKASRRRSGTGYAETTIKRSFSIRLRGP